MTIPYRVRRGLRRFFVTLGVLAILSAVALAVWLMWLSRYVIYTDEGARLDFGLSMSYPQGEVAKPSATRPSVQISYGDSDELLNQGQSGFVQLKGYTISCEMLTENLPGVQSAVANLPAGSQVMLDVKNNKGEFMYSTALGRNPQNVDIAGVAALIDQLKQKDCYLIARLPAFRDYWYFLDDETTRVPYGLPKASGNGALWLDASGPSYWFNPASTGAQNFLLQIVNELRAMGFDEVVFSEFRFPNTDQIRFEGDRTEALNRAAKTLVQACASDNFTLSFTGSHLTLPQGNCRLYLENCAAADIVNLVPQLGLENPEAQVVFITDLMDTRYDAYGVLRPLDIPRN